MLANQSPSTWGSDSTEWTQFKESIHHHYYRARVQSELFIPAHKSGCITAIPQKLGRLGKNAFLDGYKSYQSSVARKFKLEEFISSNPPAEQHVEEVCPFIFHREYCGIYIVWMNE